MKTRVNTPITNDAFDKVNLRYGVPYAGRITRQMTNPDRNLKTLKYVLIPPSKVKKARISAMKSTKRTTKRTAMTNGFMYTRKRIFPVANPVFDIDKKRNYYLRHEAAISKILEKKPKIKRSEFHKALRRYVPNVTLEISDFLFKKYHNTIPPPLSKHRLYRRVHAQRHQEFLYKLLKQNADTPKYQIVKRIRERFPEHLLTLSLIECYLINLPQYEASRRETQLREAAFSQTVFHPDKRMVHHTLKESVFFPEKRYAHPQQAKKQQLFELEHDPALQKILLRFESPNGLANRDIAPLDATQFRFLAKLIRNYPKMEIKTYASTLQGQFPLLEKTMSSEKMCDYINEQFKDLLGIIKTNKKLNSRFISPVTNDQAAFIKSQLRGYPSKNIHQIFIALAAEFPKVSTFSYSAVTTFVQNNTNVDEFSRRLPKAGYHSFRDCHKQFLDNVYTQCPRTKLMRAYSDMLIAFPDDYVDYTTIVDYLNNNAESQNINQEEKNQGL